MEWREEKESAIACASYGAFFSDTGDTEKCEEWFRLAEEKVTEDDSWTHALLASTLNDKLQDMVRKKALKKGEVQTLSTKVDAYCKKALSVDDANPFALFTLGTLSQKRNPGQATIYFNSYVEKCPEHVTVLTKIANLMYHKYKNFHKARQLYDEILAIDSSHVECLSNFAALEHGVFSNMDKARKLYERALEADPYHIHSLSNYGLFLSEVDKDVQSAELLYKRALVLSPSHANTLYNYAVLLDARGDTTEAENYYRAATRQQPRLGFAWYNLGILLEGKGDVRGAEECLVKSLECDANDPITLTDLGRLLIHKDYEEAEHLLQRALESSNMKYTRAWHELGVLHKSRGDHDKATLCFTKANQ